MHWSIMDLISQHKAAKKIQRARRHYNRFIKELERQRAILRQLFTEKVTIRMQTMIRMTLAR